MHDIDLDAYLARIGWSGPARPTLRALGSLASHHAASIAFENLNPLLGLPVSLDPQAVERKLVRDGRGGYCFEHNLLFSRALRAIGFEVSGLAARVVWNQPEDAITTRSHMVLRVDLDGETWLVDVGFGGMTLTGAIRLEAGIEQATPHEPFRLLIADGDWRMQVRLGEEWKSQYRFDLQRQHPQDYEPVNYYLSTHPSSHFVHSLVAARAAPDRRLALRNREFAVHPLGGETRRRTLGSAAEIIEVLEREFLLNLAGLPRLAARLDALP